MSHLLVFPTCYPVQQSCQGACMSTMLSHTSRTLHRVPVSLDSLPHTLTQLTHTFSNLAHMSPLLEISYDHLLIPSSPFHPHFVLCTHPKCSSSTIRFLFYKHLSNWIIFIHHDAFDSLKVKDYMSLFPHPQCPTQKMTQN